MTAPSAELRGAYAACRRITAERARSFYLGLRLAPEPERSSLFALYAWNRLGDDAVDDERMSDADRRAALASFSGRTRAILAGDRTTDGPVWAAFADVIDRHALKAEWLEDLLDGLASDLEPRQPRTAEELDRYCTRVAGSVGRCCVAIWGVRDGASTDQAIHLADQLGRAFQITNILRDVGEDAGSTPPRCYLPAEWLDRFELSHADLLAWRDSARCERLVRFIAAESRRSYQAGSRLLPMLRPRFRPTLWAMTRVYERTLDLIETEPKLAVRPRHIRPGKAAKLSVACRAIAMSALAAGRG